MDDVRPVVLHLLSGDLWGGAEAQCHDLLRALQARGRVAVAAFLFNDGLLAARLRGAGIDVEVGPESRLGVSGLSRLVSRAARDRGAAILHAHGYKEDAVAVLAGRGRRLVRTQHGSPFPGGALPYTFYYAADRLLARRFFAKTIAVSEGISVELARFLPEGRIARIRNGIAPVRDACAPPGALPFPKGTRVVASGGRLSSEKRFDRLIDAIAVVARSVPTVRLVLLGDGPERLSLEKRAADRAPGLVYFAGFEEDPGPLLRAADVFALSSDREGLPMILLEAMALGLPVVATAVGGIPEVVLAGETGLWAESLTPEGVAAPITRLLADGALRARLGAAARELVGREFCVERTAAETERLYARILEKP